MTVPLHIKMSILSLRAGVGQVPVPCHLFCLHKDIIRNNLQFWRQLLATSAGLEGTGASGDIVVLDIDDMHPLVCRPINRFVDIVDDVAIMLGDVVLDVDYDKCFCVHILFILSIDLYSHFAICCTAQYGMTKRYDEVLVFPQTLQRINHTLA